MFCQWVLFACIGSTGTFLERDCNAVDLAWCDTETVERALVTNRAIQSLNLWASGVDGKTFRLLERHRSSLEELDVSSTKITSESLAIIGTLSRLKRLNISNTRVSTNDLKHICHLQNLTALNIGYTRVESIAPLLKHLSLDTLILEHAAITDSGVQSIPARYALKELNLSNTTITDASLSSLVQLRSLRRLNLANTRITNKGLQSLDHLPMLEELDISGLDVSDEGMAGILKLTNLRKLNLASTKVSNEGACQFRYLRLVAIDVSKTRVGDKGIRSICHRSPHLSELAIGKNSSDRSLCYIAQLPRVSRLVLDNSKVTGKGIRALQASQHLTSMTLRLQNGIHADIFDELALLPRLTELDLIDAPLRVSSLAALRNHRTLEQLRLYLDEPSTNEALSCVASCARLHDLYLIGSVNKDGIKNIANSQSIRKLILANSNVDDDCILLLRRMPNLSDLGLSFTGITDRSTKVLATMDRLTQLTLFGTQLSDRSMSVLRKRLPKCHIAFIPLFKLVPDLSPQPKE
jgi:internalin A